MRRIVSHLEMSLDGVVDHPERWAHEYFNPEMLEVAKAGMQTGDTVLFGRRTYEEFAAVWPNRPEDDPFAQFLNSRRKVVVSNTLTELPWRPAELLTGDVAQGVADLKAEPGADILILGSVTLVGSLLRARLLDALDLFMVPIVIGNGTRLFDGPEPVSLQLVESKSFDNGVLSLRYAGKE